MALETTEMDHAAKFEVDRDFDPPDLRDLVGRTERLPEQTSRTIYFDTPDLRLRQEGIALLHRTLRSDAPGPGGTGGNGHNGENGENGGNQVWVIDVPGGEYNLRWPGGPDEPPAQALAILAGIVRRSKVTRVAEVETTRRRLALYDRTAADPWAEVKDETAVVVAGPNDGTRVRQIQVEFEGQDPPNAKAVLRSLHKAGANPTNRSVPSMAVGEPAGNHRERETAAGKGRRHETLRQTVRACIGSDLGRLLAHDWRLRINPGRPHPRDVHQARVATRRLRSELKTFAPLLDPVWLRHTTDELRWIGAQLGQVRDADVLADRLSQHDHRDGETDHDDHDLLRTVETRRRRAASELSSALTSARYLNLLDRLHAAKGCPPMLPGTAAGRDSGLDPDTPSARALPALVAKRWRALDRRVRKVRKTGKAGKVHKAGGGPSDEELHKIRIRAKHLRYAAEAAAPVVGKPARRTATAAAGLQTALGELHDAIAAEEWLRDAVSRPGIAPAEAFAAGVHCASEESREPCLRRHWRRAWKQLNRKQNRRWLAKSAT
jgi:CHAD domain-containing protein